MGYWGVKSYENDAAHDALDAAFDSVHGARYDELMDDANTMTFEQVQEKLASAETLSASLKALEQEFGSEKPSWDEAARLAFAGIVIRHAELQVAIDAGVLQQALEWLREETLDWDEPTLRRLRREQEIGLLGKRLV
jgi:hypothetical protein